MADVGISRQTHASGLHQVERELAALRRAMLREAGRESQMLRLSILTLVVTCLDDAQAERADEVVTRLAASHPARAIVVVARPTGEAHIEADLSLQCLLTGRGDDQVCLERVRIHVDGEPAFHLPSVVVPLLLPDVPTYLWVAATPRLDSLFAPETAALVERVILDSDAYEQPRACLRGIAERLERQAASFPLADLAWARSTPWREQMAHAFEPVELRVFLRGIEHVVIETAGDADSAQGWLLAGWLASRLQNHHGAPHVEVRAATGAPGRERSLQTVRLEAVDGERHLSVTVARDGTALTTTTDLDGAITTRSAPGESAELADLVGEQLAGRGADPVHHAALQRAAALLATP